MRKSQRSKFAITALIAGIWCLSAIPASASVGDDLEKAFNSLGGVTNGTPPSSYKGQAAGYYNGGSLYLRAPVHNAQLLSIDLPSYSGSCSGIDLHLGGLSYISMAQARELLNHIVDDGVSYATNLALETLNPMMAAVYKDLRNVIQKVNSTNINSCEMATGLVGSVFPKTQAAQQALCQDVGSGRGGGLLPAQ